MGVPRAQERPGAAGGAGRRPLFTRSGDANQRCTIPRGKRTCIAGDFRHFRKVMPRTTNGGFDGPSATFPFG